MKSILDPRSRTVLLSILFVVTGLVAYRTLASKSDRPHPMPVKEAPEAVLPRHLPHPPAPPAPPIASDIQREVEAAMAEVAAHLESVRRELEQEGVLAAEEAAEEAAAEATSRIEGIDLAPMSAAKGVRGNEEAAIQKQFDVSDGDRLKIHVPGADVRVETGRSGSAEVIVYISGRNMKQAREQFDRLRYEVFQSGDDVVVKTNPERRFRWNMSGRGGLRVRVLARIPAAFDADITTSGGDITLQDLEGRVSLKTSGGDVEVARVHGPEVHVATSGGDIRVGRIESESVQLTTSGGDIKGDVLDSRSVDVRTSGGDIRFSQLHGSSKARTSGGRIQVEGVRGDLDAATSGGRIEVVLLDEAPMILRTSGGNIVIRAPRDLQADVNLRGGQVTIDEPFHVAGRVRKQSADGSINGGGVRIDASTSGGSVSLLVNG